MKKKLGLYVHIPFCANKCDYCDFYSITGDANYHRYADAVMLHMEDYSESCEGYTVDTVFIGGGTPTVLPKNDMLDVLNSIYDNFDVDDDAEITLEANPATIDYATLKKYRQAGVNRLSIGMQSSYDSELLALSRIHSYQDFEESFEMARKAGFDNINIDVMYGIPEQTMRSFTDTIESVCALQPEHISLYGLKIENNTPFANNIENLKLPDEDTEYEMYKFAIEYMKNYGYNQYEISNFSKPGKQCKHNLKYWNSMEYLGLGPAAHSYFNGVRFSFKRDIEVYMEALEDVESNFSITDEYYEISPKERLGEYVMLRLRLTEGVDTEAFKRIFNADFEKMFGKYLDVYTENGFMEKKGTYYSFTTKGMYVSNYILSAMLDFDEESIRKISDGTDR